MRGTGTSSLSRVFRVARRGTSPGRTSEHENPMNESDYGEATASRTVLAQAATHLMLTPTVTFDGAGPPPTPGTFAEMLPVQPVGSTRPSGSVR